MAEKSTFFVDMTQFITVNMGTSLFESAGNLISNIAPVFSTLFGIYLLMVMVSFWQGGGIDEMFVDFIKRMILFAFLVALAFNASHYHELANIIYVLPDDLAKAFGDVEYSGGALDKIVDDVNTVTDKLELQQNNLGLTEFSLSMKYTIVIWQIEIFMGILLTVLFAFYILAKVSLALVLMIGPIFIGFGLFPSTRQYAMNWVGQCLNYVFNILLLSLIGSMMLVFIKDYVDIMGVEDIVTAGTLGIILFFTLIVFVLLCWMTPQLASALTGGGAIQGSMRTVYNIARKGLSKTDTGIREISNSFGGKKGGSIKKS
ncbi:MAG: type IV secretion system protein [Neisseria zoodegmatis]|uniref:type IV secretion system protein n=1 Tax=Neisseria zoodegmatis TaxID=326523 RepID=UPI0026EC16EC|nr:type IV secretion system protein [Neisseria zoodegmatis]MDO5069405.1 type IV secretion system protein [Neisseria zoodegmatis]